MSWHATAWAQAQKTGSPTSKLVLLLLAERADENGISWPSIGRLAEDAECSPDTIRRSLASLVERGLVEATTRTRENGSQTSNAYRLVMEGGPSQSARVRGSQSARGGVAICEGGPSQSARVRGSQSATPMNHQKEPPPPTPHSDVADRDGDTAVGKNDEEALAALRATGLRQAAAERLAPKVAGLIEAGWTRDALTAALTANLPASVRSLPAIIERRIDDLPERPYRAAGTPTPPPYAPDRPADAAPCPPDGWRDAFRQAKMTA